MARISTITHRDELAPEHHAVWERIARSRGLVEGPFAVLLHSPSLADRIAHLGAHVRFESALDGRLRELVVATTARELDCRFEWAAHAPLARAAGLSDTVLAAIRDRRAPAGLGAEDAQVAAYVQQLLRQHRVDETTFRELEARLGVSALVELTAAVGYYAMLAAVLNAFEVAPKPDADLLPD